MSESATYELALTAQEAKAILVALNFGQPDEPHAPLESAKTKLRAIRRAAAPAPTSRGRDQAVREIAEHVRRSVGGALGESAAADILARFGVPRRSGDE